MIKIDALTAGAVGFAVFSLWYITRNKTPTAPNLAATNYTPELLALVNRDPVESATRTMFATSDLSHWHEGYGGSYVGLKNPFKPFGY